MSDILKLFTTLAACYGPSGQEEAVRDEIARVARPLADEISHDTLGNLIVRKKGTGKRVLFAAHMDTIGLMATYIDDKGFIWFSQVGGLNPLRLIGASVRFANGTQGVVECRGKVKPAELKLGDLYIDIGAKDEASAQKAVRVGDVAVFTTVVTPLLDGRVAATYIDNRIACAVLLEAMRELPPTDNDLYFLFSTQEELGLRGARTAAYHIEPDIALSVDICGSDDTPDAEPKTPLRLGGGAGVKIRDASIICHPKVVSFLWDTAEREGIPVQREVFMRGGTDAGAIQASRGGVTAGGLSIPTRYGHNPVAVFDLADAEACLRLVRAAAAMPD